MKKHILNSNKNEQEPNETVNMIKDHHEQPITDAQQKENHPENVHTVMEPTIEISDLEDDTDKVNKNPDPHKNKSIDLDPPIPERVINNRIR